MSDPATAINHLFDREYNEFKQSVNDILMDKLQDRIGNEKIVVSQKMFDTTEQELEYDEDFEEYTDEEV